jgi:hypothetical protein
VVIRRDNVIISDTCSGSMSCLLQSSSTELIKAWTCMLEFMSVMSKEANFKSGSTWISFRSAIRCVVFFTLKVYGRRMYVCNLVTSILAIL